MSVDLHPYTPWGDVDGKTLVELIIDSKPVQVSAGTSILEAVLQTGIEIPHFCYHPKLRVVGSCRMCQVEVQGVPKLVISCATPVADGMEVLTASERVKKARNAVLEFLLLNHPLDCPVCDKGGECPPQNWACSVEATDPRSVSSLAGASITDTRGT